MGTEGRLVHVRRVHPHLMISRAEIQLSEETCAAKLVQEFVHHQDWELILHRLFIQRTIIHTKTAGVVRLFLPRALATRTAKNCGE